MKKTRLISFEGIDGSGKSTQIELLKKWFSKQGIEFIVVRDPGGTYVSEKVRNILLDRKNLSLCTQAETFLFLAARSQLVSEIIAPALNAGKFVICDRFIDSTIAYQGYGRGLDIAVLKKINKMAINEYRVGKTFFVDIPVEISLDRRSSSINDRMESMGIEFLNKVRQGYKTIYESDFERIVFINGMDSKKKVFEKIKQSLKSWYEELR